MQDLHQTFNGFDNTLLEPIGNALEIAKGGMDSFMEIMGAFTERSVEDNLTNDETLEHVPAPKFKM